MTVDRNRTVKPDSKVEEGSHQPSEPMRVRLNSRELFADSREIIIEHVRDEYRLRLTSQGKLILTK